MHLDRRGNRRGLVGSDCDGRDHQGQKHLCSTGSRVSNSLGGTP
jgi:hypothetical protein